MWVAKCGTWLGVTLAIIFGGRDVAAGAAEVEGRAAVLRSCETSWRRAVDNYQRAFERLHGSSLEVFDALALRVFNARNEILIEHFVPLLLESCSSPKPTDLIQEDGRQLLEARIVELRGLDEGASRDGVVLPTGCLSARWLLPPSPLEFVAFSGAHRTSEATTPGSEGMAEAELDAVQLLQKLLFMLATLMSHLLSLVDADPEAHGTLIDEAMPAVEGSLNKLSAAFGRLKEHLIEQQLRPEFIRLLETTANVAVMGIYGLRECEREIQNLFLEGHVQEGDLWLFQALARCELKILDPQNQADQEYAACMSRVPSTKRAKS